MQTLTELEEQALQLSERDRATLAAHLLDSLPLVLSDTDEGLAEALRRDAEMDQDPSASLALDEIKRDLKP